MNVEELVREINSAFDAPFVLAGFVRARVNPDGGFSLRIGNRDLQLTSDGSFYASGTDLTRHYIIDGPFAAGTWNLVKGEAKWRTRMSRFLDELREAFSDPRFWLLLIVFCLGVFVGSLLCVKLAHAAQPRDNAPQFLTREAYCKDLAALAFESLMDYRRNPHVIISAMDPQDETVIALAKDWQGTPLELQQKVMKDCAMQTQGERL